MLVRDFDFRIRAWKPRVTPRIHRLSVVRFGPDGRVAWHRDCRDAAGELYAKLQLVGPLVRYPGCRMG